MNQTEILQGRLRDIDKRLAEIEARLQQLPPATPTSRTYESQELDSERRHLAGLRRATDEQLRSLTAGPDPKQLAIAERRERVIDANTAHRRANIESWVAELERQGDHRQARLWRAELVGLREKVAAEHT